MHKAMMTARGDIIKIALWTFKIYYKPTIYHSFTASGYLMNILITGGSGFVGSFLAAELGKNESMSVSVSSRSPLQISVAKTIRIKNFFDQTEWHAVFDGQDVVIHTAARDHVMNEQLSRPLNEYRRVNVVGSLGIFCAAAKAGVQRFIYLSSVKVNGEQTEAGRSFKETDTPNPIDPYGISKFEAEQKLYELSKQLGMELVVVRPPLIYGPGVKGHLATLISLVKKGVPLPFGAINNQRTLLGLQNLTEFISVCTQHEKAANQTFLVGDPEDISTTELIKLLATAQNKTPLLLPIPSPILKTAAHLFAKKGMAERLLGSLQVDTTKAYKLLGWAPSISVADGLKHCVGFTK